MAREVAVSVDRDFARFDSKAYAINKINTVDVTAKYPHSQSAVIVWGGLAALSVVVFSGAQQNAAAVLLCAVFGLLAYRAWQRSKIVEYHLILVTSSHSVQAIKSEDGDFIQSIRNRIERAIAGRLD